MKYVWLIPLALTLFTACKELPTVGESRISNQRLIGTPQGIKTLPLPMIGQCDRAIQKQIATFNKPWSWKKVVTQTPLDDTNLYIPTSHPTISKKVGFDVSRSVAFAVRYQGDTSVGILQYTDFVCLYDKIPPNSIAFKAAYSQSEFQNLWGVDYVPPAQWGAALR